MSLFVFAMQHGMLWAGNPLIPEQLGGVRRPWSVPDQSGRIFVGDPSVGPSTVRAA